MMHEIIDACRTAGHCMLAVDTRSCQFSYLEMKVLLGIVFFLVLSVTCREFTEDEAELALVEHNKWRRAEGATGMRKMVSNESNKTPTGEQSYVRSRQPNALKFQTTCSRQSSNLCS
jgi:hypothetical protein